MSRRAPGSRTVAPIVAVISIALLVAGCGRPVGQELGVAAAVSTPTPRPVSSLLPVITPAPSTALAGPGASTTQRPPTRIPENLRGVWAAEVEGTTASSGSWQLKITPDDMQLLNPADKSSGFFSIWPSAFDAASFTLEPAWDCPDQPSITEGHYTWAYDGTSLRFTLVSDSCGDRAGVLTASPWTRLP